MARKDHSFPLWGSVSGGFKLVEDIGLGAYFYFSERTVSVRLFERGKTEKSVLFYADLSLRLLSIMFFSYPGLWRGRLSLDSAFDPDRTVFAEF